MQQLEYVRFPEDAGISSQGILNYIAAREAAGLEHHAIWVLRHGKVAATLAWAPYDDHPPHMLFSLSKSFCSAAAASAAPAAVPSAAAGVDSVEHGAYQDADSLAAMAEMGTVWVPI